MGYLNTYIVPTAFTILLHVIVLFFVVVGWQMSDSTRFRVDTPRHIKARLVSLKQTQPKVVQKRAERQVVKQAKPRTDPAPKQAAVKPVAEKPAAVKPVEETASRIPVVPVPSADAEPEPEPQTEPVADRVPEVDPEAVRRQEREADRQQQQADFQQALEEEEYLLQAEEDELQADSYAAMIKRRVEGYWSRPPSARKNMEVELSIRLVPSGEVVGVEVVRSSGSAVFDRSAILAVEKAGSFPELKDMSPTVFEAYFRRFTLIFKPEDLLL